MRKLLLGAEKVAESPFKFLWELDPAVEELGQGIGVESDAAAPSLSGAQRAEPARPATDPGSSSPLSAPPLDEGTGQGIWVGVGEADIVGRGERPVERDEAEDKLGAGQSEGAAPQPEVAVQVGAQAAPNFVLDAFKERLNLNKMVSEERKRLELLSRMLVERVREIVGLVGIRHSLYYKNQDVVEAIAEFMVTGGTPSLDAKLQSLGKSLPLC